MTLPKFVVLKSNYNNKYLGYVPKEEFKDVHQGAEATRNSFLRFYISDVDSPYTKFEVQRAEIGNGLVHLKCCYNNKYWVRWSPNHWWIVAAAQEPEEDKSKWSCTLFKPIYVDGNAKTVRFLHVQLGHYACLWRIGAPFGYCLFGGSKDPDKDSQDVVTIIDWDSLLKKSQSFSLPRYVVLKSNYNNKYLAYVPKYEFKDIDQGVEPTRNSFLQFFITEDVSPYTKFEVHKAKIGNGLVHIRCCYNNKYWVRWSKNHWWIVAAADEPEENQSQWSCTLFKPIDVDRDAKSVRFMHVQLGHYACLWRIGPPFGDCLFGGSKDPNGESCDVVTVIDWDSLLTTSEPVALPRFVVLKSNYNKKYLGYVPKDEFKDIHQGVVPTRNCFLRFYKDDVVSPYTKFQVKRAKSGNGLVHLRCCYNNKYWVRWSKNHWWIVAAAHEPEEDQSKWSCTLFKPIYVDRHAKTVRFLHVQLGHYACLWNIGAPFGGCLFGGSLDPDGYLRDVVTIVDWESQVTTLE